jgi:hypothetical protein
LGSRIWRGWAVSEQISLNRDVDIPQLAAMQNPFRYFNSSPAIIRLAVMMYVRFPLSLRQVEDLLSERGIDICHETVRFWWNRFGRLFAAEIRNRRIHLHSHSEPAFADRFVSGGPAPTALRDEAAEKSREFALTK